MSSPIYFAKSQPSEAQQVMAEVGLLGVLCCMMLGVAAGGVALVGWLLSLRVTDE